MRVVRVGVRVRVGVGVNPFGVATVSWLLLPLTLTLTLSLSLSANPNRTLNADKGIVAAAPTGGDYCRGRVPAVELYRLLQNVPDRVRGTAGVTVRVRCSVASRCA